MSKATTTLSRSIGITPEYEDANPLGTPISGQVELGMKNRLRPIVELLRHGAHPGGDDCLRALGALLEASACADLHEAPCTLREEILYPPPSRTLPRSLRVERSGQAPVRVALPAPLFAELAGWLGDWQREDARAPRGGPARALHETLARLGCFEAAPAAPPLPAGATFIGHATVLLSSATTRVVVDPFLLPAGAGSPPGYQPITHGDFHADAVLITHGHRDHFHLDSLLRLGRDTLVIVPEVTRESLLSIDMAARLRQLGFCNVRALPWSGATKVGDLQITALPFYGEQPTTEDVLHPELRNLGNNYLVESGGRRYAFVADAGRDRAGDVRALAATARARHGAVDVLFGGYRSWSLYPAQYAMSSVAQYLLLVPPAQWGTRQQIMNDAHALLDTAEGWHARHVVPYADGGAPWYWQLGLGPRLDDTATVAPTNPHFDPRPDAVIRAAAERSSDGARVIPSPVRALLMRPGESLDLGRPDAAGADGANETAKIVGNPGHIWPFAAPDAVATAPGSQLEPQGLTKKRVLLRLLARDELKRRGIEVDAEQVQDMSDELRRDNHLTDRGAMLGWLDSVGLSMDEYGEILQDWRGVICLEGALAGEIEKHIAGQRAFASMRQVKVR